ncbi:helix-turn-helix domain-containing protein [Pseudomonas sp. A-B-26]|uniref:helix-turn-helix domain-containing protein n=1 Tax=Pseudomonas sp. A-B-26 TaxID=2832406 RepID=UPI001CBF1645|nr:helix-turn-helix domain-containing protein [Pseudomonas sp. A-B-26]
MTKEPKPESVLWFCKIQRGMITSSDFKELSPAAFKIYVVLKMGVNYHSGETEIFHSSIANHCGLSISSVKRGLTDLKRKGYVTSEGTPGQNCIYRVFERIPLRLKGKAIATATYLYTGKTSKSRANEIKKILITGKLPTSSPMIKIEINEQNQLIKTEAHIPTNEDFVNNASPGIAVSSTLPAAMGRTLEKHMLRAGKVKIEDANFHSNRSDDDDLAHE